MSEAYENADLLTIALLKSLADLDELDGAAATKRRNLAKSCLDMVKKLQALGGGSLGEARLTQLRSALAEAAR